MTSIADRLRSFGLDKAADVWERPGHQNFSRQTALTNLMVAKADTLGPEPEVTRREFVLAMLEAGVDPNARGLSKARVDTALGVGIQFGRPKAVLEPLVSAQTVWTDELAQALSHNNADACELLLGRDDLLLSPYNFPWVVGLGDPSDIERALKLGASVERGVTHTPLVMAVIYDRAEIVQQLLDAGADINRPGTSGPPIFWAQNLAMIDRLVERGANLEARFDGRNLLSSIAVRAKLDEQWHQLVRGLLARGLDPTSALPMFYYLIAESKIELSPKELGGDANALIRGSTVASSLPTRQLSGLKGSCGTKADKNKGHFERLEKLVLKKTAKLTPERPEWRAAIKLLTYPKNATKLDEIRSKVDSTLGKYLEAWEHEELTELLEDFPEDDYVRALTLLALGGPTMRDTTGRNALTFLLDPDDYAESKAFKKIPKKRRTQLGRALLEAGFPLVRTHWRSIDLKHYPSIGKKLADRGWALDASVDQLRWWFKADPKRALAEAQMGTKNALAAAASLDWDDGVKAALDSGAPVEVTNVVTKSAVLATESAVEKGATTALELLFEAGADPNAASYYGPLLSQCQSDEVVDLVIAKGGRLDAYNMQGNTALHTLAMLVFQSNIDRFSGLLQRGANPNARDRTGATPLFRAVSRSPAKLAIDLAKLLLDAGADPNLQTVSGKTAAHVAATLTDRAPLLELLVSAGADLRLMHNGKTVLDALVTAGHESLAKHLAFPGMPSNPLGFSVIEQLRRLGIKLSNIQGQWELSGPGPMLMPISRGSSEVHTIVLGGSSEDFSDIKELPGKTFRSIAWCDDYQYNLCVEKDDTSKNPAVREIDHEGWDRGSQGSLEHLLSRLKPAP